MAYLLKLDEYLIISLKVFPTSKEIHTWGHIVINSQKTVMY